MQKRCVFLAIRNVLAVVGLYVMLFLLALLVFRQPAEVYRFMGLAFIGVVYALRGAVDLSGIPIQWRKPVAAVGYALAVGISLALVVAIFGALV